MANHHLTVAKATFAASLLRPDVTKIDRSELPHFHTLLETAATRCSSSNIQKCKQWLLDNILSSSQRSSSFARYLIAFAKYLQEPQGQKPCSPQRLCLHILYLLNDLFHHAKYHAANNEAIIHDLVQTFQPSVLELVKQASLSAKARVCKRLQTLISLWQDAGYFEPDFIAKVNQVMSDPSTSLGQEEKVTADSKSTREAPYIMPPTHGDPSLPFYELPAGNLMLHIVPNKSIPMRPHSIRPLQFNAGPADKSLANAVRDFLKDIETIDHEFDLLDEPTVHAEISDMGQVLYRNEAEDLVGDTYFGWSRAFCEKMRARKRAGANGDTASSQARSLSPDWSRSRSRSPRKRKFSGSDNNSSRSRSDSRSRSRSKQHLRRPSMSPTDTHQQPQSMYNPEYRPQQFQSSNFPHPLPTIPPAVHEQQLPPIPPPPPFMGGMALMPPMPPNWQGPWPPPPPPPPPGMAANVPSLPSNLRNPLWNLPSTPNYQSQHHQ